MENRVADEIFHVKVHVPFNSYHVKVHVPNSYPILMKAQPEAN
jgi:hypothetical protein